MTSMVDDDGNVARSPASLRRQLRDIMFLKAALGFIYSWDKCKVHPARTQEFLGFVVDLANRRFCIPDHKVQRFNDMLERTLQDTADPQLLRSSLGLLASFSLALPMAPLLGRWLRQAAAEERGVDDQDARLLQFWREHLPRLNGRSWDRLHTTAVELNADRALLQARQASSPAALRLASDASEHGFGAFLPDATECWQMAVPFSQEQRVAMQSNNFSSTEREVTGFIVALQELHRTGRLKQTGTVQIWTDSQAAYADCLRMRGTPTVFAAVRTLYTFAWEQGVNLEFVWVPRTHELLTHADQLSKLEDPTDWGFSRKFAESQIFNVVHRKPSLDCLASAEVHMCETYFSTVFDGKCVAVDGMLQPWNTWPARAHHRTGKPFCWVFPPQSLALPAALKIQRERADAVLVLPRQLTTALEQVLRATEEEAVFAQRFLLSGPHARMIFPSRRVPVRVAQGGWKTPMMAIVVSW
jgi:ribonuclease HI